VNEGGLRRRRGHQKTGDEGEKSVTGAKRKILIKTSRCTQGEGRRSSSAITKRGERRPVSGKKIKGIFCAPLLNVEGGGGREDELTVDIEKVEPGGKI